MAICPKCKASISDLAVFCPQCEHRISHRDKDPSMTIILGQDDIIPTKEQEIARLVKDCQTLEPRAQKKTDRAGLIWLFNTDMMMIAHDAWSCQIYDHPVFVEAFIRAAKAILLKL
jgi:DNA-directed RNA polymerase subunit RPC12/RpoP